MLLGFVKVDLCISCPCQTKPSWRLTKISKLVGASALNCFEWVEVLNALGKLCLWQCLGSWCNIHISLKNNSDLVLMMTVMMRPSRLNVERGASQIRLTGLAYKKRTSDFNGWQMRVFPPNTTIPRWSYRAHLCNHQNKLFPSPQTGAGESRVHPHAHKSGEESDIFLPGQTWSINQLNGSLLPSLPLLMVQTHDTATTKATTQMQNAPKTLQHYHMCIITTTQQTYKNIHDMIDIGKNELYPGQVHWPSKSCLLSYLENAGYKKVISSLEVKLHF